MFEKLRKIRQEKNIKAKEIAEKLGLKTEGAYYKKRNRKCPFYTRRRKDYIGHVKDANRRNFFYK